MPSKRRTHLDDLETHDTPASWDEVWASYLSAPNPFYGTESDLVFRHDYPGMVLDNES